jgi:hypothetical protein
VIFTRETNPAATYRTDCPPHEWDYRELRDQLDARAVALGQKNPIPQYPTTRAPRIVHVYVNHGRWLWDCPICRASYMAAGTARGYCTNCWNAAEGWFPLAFPPERAAIEAALDDRPDPATRNWFPPETVADLEAENVERGVAA